MHVFVCIYVYHICVFYFCIFIHTSTHRNTYIHVRIYVHMGWLRLVGCLKLQASFAEYRLFYRARLQTIPVIVRSLLIGATPHAAA